MNNICFIITQGVITTSKIQLQIHYRNFVSSDIKYCMKTNNVIIIDFVVGLFFVFETELSNKRKNLARLSGEVKMVIDNNTNRALMSHGFISYNLYHRNLPHYFVRELQSKIFQLRELG